MIRLKSLLFSAPKVDYDDCRTGATRIVPTGPLLDALRSDYEAMVAQGMFRADDPPPPFPALVERLASLERDVNAV